MQTEKTVNKKTSDTKHNQILEATKIHDYGSLGQVITSYLKAEGYPVTLSGRPK